MPQNSYKNLYENMTHQKLAQQPTFVDSETERVNEWEQAQFGASPEMRLMCARGLLMCLCMEQLGEFHWLEAS